METSGNTVHLKPWKKGIFEQQIGCQTDAEFLEKLTAFNRYLFSSGLTPATSE